MGVVSHRYGLFNEDETRRKQGMRRICVALAVMLSMAVPAMAVDFTFHGDLDHRFRMFTNQPDFFNSIDKGEKLHRDDRKKLITDSSNGDFMGEIKYRLWTTAASDNGAIKGVFAVEIGGIQFGDKGKGGGFSGDGVNIETRMAYTDFALGNGRARIGLMPIHINKFLWSETVTGIDYKVAVGNGDLTVAWYRGYEVVASGNANDFKDLDALYARYDMKPMDGMKLGMFALWQTSDGLTAGDIAKEEADIAANKLTAAADLATATAQFDLLGTAAALSDLNAAQAKFTTADSATATAPPTHYYTKGFTGWDLDLYTLGVDGGMKSGDLFANWDLMYQMGDFMEEVDFGGYFAHFDIGMNIGKGKLTYTFWYASGDDDPYDGDYDAFISTDIDINSEYSVVLFEGYTNDDYFSSSPYLQDKGLILNRIGYDYQATDKLKVGAAALYLMTAEDIVYDDDLGIERKNDKIGFEFDAYAKYQLFSSTVVSIQFGYLLADDAMDYYEVECDGSSDEDIYIISSSLRYKF